MAGAVLAPLRSALVWYDSDQVYHERVILAEVGGGLFMIVTPDREIFPMMLTVPPQSAVRFMNVQRDLPVGITQAECYMVGENTPDGFFDAADQQALRDEGERRAALQRNAGRVRLLPGAAAAAGGGAAVGNNQRWARARSNAAVIGQSTAVASSGEDESDESVPNTIIARIEAAAAAGTLSGTNSIARIEGAAAAGTLSPAAQTVWSEIQSQVTAEAAAGDPDYFPGTGSRAGQETPRPTRTSGPAESARTARGCGKRRTPSQPRQDPRTR
jgi:hypothetical protein